MQVTEVFKEIHTQQMNTVSGFMTNLPTSSKFVCIPIYIYLYTT
jgi:hypothetical protein